ncbi:ABC transporter substrate-binding protein [Plantibacter sp. Mn2098]|uniref:ABC transporter substrate-binding protein n=1 Tax=Plantibacter sp. Mn2098 TaxID=3395266 RepID=UPI003BCDF6C8
MRRAILTAGAIIASVTLLAGCSANGGTANTDSSGPVKLTFWDWDPGMDSIVDVWNKAHPDIQVKLANPAGGDELVSKLITAHKAGNAPDITKVEYQSLPALVSNGVAADISDYTADSAKDFGKAALSQVQFEDKTYGVPQDFAPLVFFYRQDVFDSLGLKAPTTWDEYAAAAATIHAADPTKYLGTFSAGDPGWFAGLTQQAGANWWSAKGKDWTVDIKDAPSTKVADYWRGLIDQGVIKGDPFWSAQWNKEMDDGTLVGWISGAWAPAQFGGIAPNTVGKWTMTSLPAWTAGDKTTGIWGGSAISVTTDSKHPKQAAEFVNWLNTSDEALALQVEKINIFPAATSGQKLDALTKPPAFMPNQPDYYKTIADIAADARSFDIWGPNATVTFGAYKDGFAAAIQNKTSFSDVLGTMQDTTVTDMKKLGFTVNK